MKVGVIFFHKNILKLYRKEWITQCVQSILYKTYQYFDIFEINYGNTDYSIFENVSTDSRRHYFYQEDLEDHTYAMNFILSKAFSHDCDIVFNTNLDDYYHPNRFVKQINMVNQGYDLVSSFWYYVNENNEITNKMNHELLRLKCTGTGNPTKCTGTRSTVDGIFQQLSENNNVLNHSGVCFTKKMWSSFDKFNNRLRYDNRKPYEDLILWQKTISGGLSIGIVPDYLIYCRIKDNQH